MIRAWFRSSIVVRTTLIVLAVTVLIGLVADQLTYKITQRREAIHQQEAMESLLDVVEPSAAAACFVGDQALAKQVVQGLVGTRSIQAALLRSGSDILAQAAQPSARPAPPGAATFKRRLASPFSAESQIGELVLVQDTLEADRMVARTTTMVRTIVFALTLALGLIMAITVHHTITRPIRNLSGSLHQLEATVGDKLLLPNSHAEDEIGQLVNDVNALVESLVDALWAERELSEHLELDKRKVQAILENAGTGIFVVRGNGAMEAWTPAFLRQLNLENSPPPKGAMLPVFFGLGGTQVDEWLKTCLAEGKRKVKMLKLQDFSGNRHRWLQITLDPIGPDWIQGLLEDVTTYEEATQAAQELAVRDSLTGTLNRLGAERILSGRLFKAHQGLGVFMVDLDLFKEVNDTYGHDAGDEVLRQAAIRMTATLRRSDLVARLGGDEFLLFVDFLSDPEIAIGLAEKVITAIGMPIKLSDGTNVHVGASIGITLVHPEERQPLEAVLKRADMAMYQAKQAGRNCARLVRE